jgi:hypothetical protein
VDEVAHQVQDIFLAVEILVEGADGNAGRTGNLPRSGFMEALLDKQADGRVRNLAAPAFDQMGLDMKRRFPARSPNERSIIFYFYTPLKALSSIPL